MMSKILGCDVQFKVCKWPIVSDLYHAVLGWSVLRLFTVLLLTMLSGRFSMEAIEKKTAVFAGGCFWCIESNFEHLDGVQQAISGYMGGAKADPSYEEVCSGKSGHLEVVQVIYDPSVVSYDQLCGHFWTMIDPTDGGGSFYDRGEQYTSAIFYGNEHERRIAEIYKAKINRLQIFESELKTAIRPLETFYEAESYHQDYYKKKSSHYQRYRSASGRDAFCIKNWKEIPSLSREDYERPAENEIKSKLTELQYHVTQKCGTERPFSNLYWDHKEAGIYVDVVSGEPLFCSLDKFDSGTGWPSFSRTLNPGSVYEKEDHSHGMKRIEVRSKQGDSHLGHLFDDGPKPTRLRYCINSASLRFVPAAKLAAEGYDEFEFLFKDIHP